MSAPEDSRRIHPGARRRSQLRVLFMGGGTLIGLAFLFSTLTRPPAYTALVGQPAPDTSLPLVGGGTLDLNSHAGDIVVLDFWATWCPPCRTTMPVLDRIADDYVERGVHLYFVNVGESPDTVNDFVGGSGLHAPVALDSDQSLRRAFLVEGIPFTAIVGRDGTIRSVRVGASPGLEAEFRADLDAALAEPVQKQSGPE